jgi:peptidoglycan/xylan/chitin deacetylase (PgdA/CDA1 family)
MVTPPTPIARSWVRPAVAVLVAVALFSAACGGGEGGEPSPEAGQVTAPTVSPEFAPSPTPRADRSPPTPIPEATAEPEPEPTQVPALDAEPEPPAKPKPDPEPEPRASFPAALAGQDIEVIPTDRLIVALTFDAGANAAAVPSILDTLAQEEITATFFLTGAFVRNFPAESRSIVAAGHRLANHSVTHPAFTTLTSAELRAEVLDAEREISDIAGADPRPHFRFPLGDRNARTIAAVNDLGYVAIRWTIDTLGWQGTTGGRSAAEVTRRVLDTAQPGQIVLMHVGSHPADASTLDADALPGIINGLRDLGYEFVTLDVLL